MRADNVIDGFEPLLAFDSEKCCWHDKSRIFALAVADFGYGYLLVQLPDLRISFIKMFNPFPLNIHFHKEALVISYDDDQLSLKNSIETFGGGRLEIPSKMYLKLKDIEIPINGMAFYSRGKLQHFSLLTQSDNQYTLDPTDGGFREFKRIFPQSTKHEYNTRQLEVYQLEAFAGYGDKQSIEWLNAIKEKTNGHHSRWETVTSYIGFQKRGARWRKY